MSMMNGPPLKVDEVREQVQEDDRGKWDLLIDRKCLTMQDGVLHYPPDYSHHYPNDLQPTHWATAQMCGRLGIPTAYFRRCPVSLRDVQFNHWISAQESGDESEADSEESPIEGAASSDVKSNSPEQWLLRAKHDRLRGVLGERYAPLDNASLLECLVEASVARMQVGWFSLTDESLHLRLIEPGQAREVLPADRLQVGIHIGNSEVGKRAVTIDAMVFRLVCSNGMIRLVQGKNLLYRRHIHLSAPNFVQMLQEAMREALTTASGLLERLSWATSEPVREVEATIAYFGNLWVLSQRTQEQVKLALLSERADQQETLYGLVNAFTNAAQQLPPDDRYRLEVLTGRLLEQGLKGFESGVPALPQPAGSTGRRHLSPITNGHHGAMMMPSRSLNGTVA